MSKQSNVEEQEVRDLIAGAGPRAVAPAEELKTIRGAAREEWRRMVEVERRRRRGARSRARLALAAGLILAVAAGWWLVGRPAPLAAPVVASVELLTGVARFGDGVELAMGGEIPAGATVETGGWPEGSPVGMALRLAGGQSLRLAADSRVRLVSERRFELERGTLYIDSGSPAADGLEVITALGTVRDIGTQFEVRLGAGDSALRLRVREGECLLEAAGESHSAIRGEQLTRSADGSPTRIQIEPYGPEWDWVMATAPGLEIEGLPLSSFLAWATREIGREVRWASSELADAAQAEITVHGSIEGLSPEEALEWVLRGTGLRYEVENGTIFIAR